jgi:hypothetical protein
MLVRYGSLKGPVSFYSIDQRMIVGTKDINEFTSYSGKSLRGAGLLKMDDNSGPYLPADDFGEIEMTSYNLPPNWNRESQGPGGIALPYVPDPEKLDVNVLELATTSGILIISSGPAGVAMSVAAFSVTVYDVMKDSEFVPVYYPKLPQR